ncbi:hypothetical protein V8C86DRAFT_3091346 [Haematococcus lacustris]
METLGTLHASVEAIISFAADWAGFAALYLCRDQKGGVYRVVGSRDGSGFTTLFEVTAKSMNKGPSGMAADSEGYIWVAKKDRVSRFTATGGSTGTRFSVQTAQTAHPGQRAPLANVSALQCLEDSSSIKGGKVLFMSSSYSLCQLDLGSKEVKVLAAAFPHPSARLFSGPGPLAALLVPGKHNDPVGSSLYSCSEEGELQLLRSGLTVAHNMLAVNKVGDVLFFQPHAHNKELLSLVCIRSALPPQVAPQVAPDLKPGKRNRLL